MKRLLTSLGPESNNDYSFSQPTVPALAQAERKFFDDDFLKPEATADDFFKGIQYSVALNDLLHFKRTCCYHASMEYVPVMVKITEQRLIDHYNGGYLLQIWYKDGTKVYELALKDEVYSWNIYFDYFLFQVKPNEAGAGFFYIVKLQSNPSVVKVKDFVNDKSYKFLGISDQLLHISNGTHIKIVDVKIDLKPGETREVDIDKDKILDYAINKSCRLLGFFENSFSRTDTYIQCIIETEDNQIDFGRLYFWSRDFALKDLQFYQYREVVPRSLRNDPIQDFKQIILSDEFQYGVALRKSGEIDLYWNFTLTNSPQGVHFKDTNINFQYIYLEKEDGERLKIATKWSGRLGLEVATDTEELKDKHWHKVIYPMISNHARIYSSLCIFGTLLFVSHNDTVSVYDILTAKWTDHFFFEGDIYSIARTNSGDQIEASKLCVYLKNGKILYLDEKEGSFFIEEASDKFEGAIKCTATDSSNNVNTHYSITGSTGTLNLYAHAYDSVANISKSVTGLDENCCLARFFSPSLTSQFALYNKFSLTLSIYSYDGRTTTAGKAYQVQNGAEIVGIVHSVVQISGSDQLLLIDELNFYKLDVDQLTVRTYDNQKAANMCVIDDCHAYSMSNRNEKKEHSGLYYQDLSLFINKEKESHLRLDYGMVGVNAYLNYNEWSGRVAYMSDYSSIEVVPIMHRNTINFFALKGRDEYVTLRKLNDRLIALDKFNRLTTWSISTGKLIQIYNLGKKGIDLSDYVVWQCNSDDVSYVREWYQPICLLKQKSQVEDFTAKDYFEPSMITTSIPNNTAYVNILEKEFHRLKVVEIVNEREIKEYFTFVHPVYTGEPYQRLYFSDDLQFMLERLTNERVFLYQRQESTAHPGANATWKIVRRIAQFPMDISESCYANYLFSPDLMSYLDFNEHQNQFEIKSALTQTVIVAVSTGLMNPVRSNVKELSRRFRWIDSNRIKLINEEGIEKIVDIKDGFKELSYGSVPLIDLAAYKERKDKVPVKLHYYYQKEELALGATLQRLTRCFQDFKSAYYLDVNRDPHELYNVLFSVDYAVATEANGTARNCVANLSFTFLHWKMTEMICEKDSALEIKQLGSDEARLLVLNIFPRFNTVVHYAVKKLDLIIRIYDMAEKQREKGKDFVIPFIKNIDGLSPLHRCFQYRNYKSAEVFIEKLRNDSIDNHGRAIATALPLCVAFKLSSLGEYLDSRFFETEQVQEARQGQLVPEDGKNYVVSHSELWPDISEVRSKLFKPSSLDSECKIQFLDVPAVHCYAEKISDEFFDALSDTNQYELFEKRSVQAMIDFKWPLAREYTLKILFFPFLAFQAVFITYQNVFFGQLGRGEQEALPLEEGEGEALTLEQELLKAALGEAGSAAGGGRRLASEAFAYFSNHTGKQLLNETLGVIQHSLRMLEGSASPAASEGTAASKGSEGSHESDLLHQENIGAHVLESILVLFCLYFLVIEAIQLYRSGFRYFLQVWNYTDFVPPILIIIQIGMHLGHIDEKRHFIETIRAFASLLMWAKLLYFMRLFKATGAFIRNMLDTLYNIRVYLFLLAVANFAFGEAFLRLSENSEGEGAFVRNYAIAWVYSFMVSRALLEPSGYKESEQPVTAYIMLTLCGLITNVVMMNLLIAILTDQFDKVLELGTRSGYQERARIISDASFLIPTGRKADFCPTRKYLVLAVDEHSLNPGEEEEKARAEEESRELLTKISKMVTDIKSDNAEYMDEVDKKIEKYLGER